MKIPLITLCIGAALIAGCSSSNQPQESSTYQWREETKKLEAASAVGYDGTAIHRSVDSTLNRNDDHNRALDKALKVGDE